MATSGENTEPNTKPTIDVVGFFRAFVKTDSDSDSEADDTVSMFCKACLHPYSGEEKAGTIVLRCKNCGQTDTILEEKVGNINPQQWIGDLMKNRFLQVIKEQENLKLNLVDPNFCDDDYKRVTLALQEYTSNIQAVAECMYEVVKHVNFPSLDEQLMVSVEKEAVEIEAMRATNRLIKIHKALLEHSEVKKTDAPGPGGAAAASERGSGAVERRGSRKKSAGKRAKGKKPPQVEAVDSFDYENDRKEIAEMTREHSQTLGNTVLTLINELIDKYELPCDLMERIEVRIIRQFSEDCEAKRKLEQEKREANATGRAGSGKKRRGKKGGGNDGNGSGNRSADKEKMKERSGDGKDGDKGGAGDGKDKGKETAEAPVEEPVDDRDVVVRAREILAETERKEKDPYLEQFFAAFEEKFSIKFSEKEIVKFTEDEVDQMVSDAINSTDDSEPALAKAEAALKGMKDVSDEKISRATAAAKGATGGGTGGKLDVRVKKKDRKQDLSMHFKKTSDGFMVNFYTLSAAFINELQAIKSESLDHRKEKALAELHSRIQGMKNEMEKIEDAVTTELAKAYDNKMRKSAKQRQKMDERQQQLREAEQLLYFYARTGQHDKIHAMNEELDKLCGNPN